MKAADAPWYRLPPPPLRRGGSALIVGAGLAGCSAAYHLAQQAISVTVLEANQAPALEASGNPAAVILPFPSLANDAMNRFYRLAWRYSLDLLERLQAKQGLAVVRSGVVHLLDSPGSLKCFRNLSQGLQHEAMITLSPLQTNLLTGLKLDRAALHYPQGCYLNPSVLCAALLDHDHIHVRTNAAVADYRMEKGCWNVYDAHGKWLAKADVLVLANAHQAEHLPYGDCLSLCCTLGQLTLVSHQHLACLPKTVICHHGYLIPDVNGHVLMGATWRKDQGQRPVLMESDQLQLIDECNQFVSVLKIPANLPLKGRVARRTGSPDYLPSVGAMIDTTAFKQAFGRIRHGDRRAAHPLPPHVGGLYASVAHGARGLLSTPISGALLAALICGSQCPLPEDVIATVNPARFLIRKLKRAKR